MDDYVAGLDRPRGGATRSDDMVTALVAGRGGGDRLSDDELRSMIAALLFAGYDTTRNQLGLAMWLFAEHPDQWKLLASDPTWRSGRSRR